MNQGKRQDQIEFSNIMAVGSMVGLIVILLISFIVSIVI